MVLCRSDVDTAGGGHFVVFVPVGVVFAGDCDGEQRQRRECFVEFASEDLSAECIEYPLAASVAGVYSGEDGYGVFVECVGEGIGGLFHKSGSFDVRHVVSAVFPGDGDAYCEARIFAELVYVGTTGDDYVVTVIADGGACPEFSFHSGRLFYVW